MGKGTVSHNVYKLAETFFQDNFLFYSVRTCIEEILSEGDAKNIADYSLFISKAHIMLIKILA